MAEARQETNTQSVTPSQVFEYTERMRLQLQALGLLDSRVYANRPSDEALYHPRHVLQEVRECHMVLSKLLEKRGKTPARLPEPDILREIRPDDVARGVEHLLSDIAQLHEGPPDVVDPPAASGSLPADVYNNLQKICRAIPVALQAADAWPIAMAVRENMEKIAAGRGYAFVVPRETLARRSEPGQVYRDVWSFLDDLRQLALHSDFAIPGGVILPSRFMVENVRVQDILTLLNEALAETDAIKYALNIRETAFIPRADERRTLADISLEVGHAAEILNTLLKRETLPGSEAERP